MYALGDQPKKELLMPKMPKLKLTYFDFDGGRAEAARLALHIGNIPFEDDRFGFDEFPARKATYPFSAVPILWVDGAMITQSTAITRYTSKLAGLYPNDPLAALHSDEVIDGLEDLTSKMVSTFGLEGDELKAAIEKFVEGPLTLFLQAFEKILADRGPDYFVGNAFSVADLSMFVWLKGLQSGHLDHVPTTVVQTAAPGLLAHYKRIKGREDIATYYRERDVPLA